MSFLDSTATSRNLNAESEIAQLAIQKTKLTRQLEELREKHKIKREIKRLEKEIQELLSGNRGLVIHLHPEFYKIKFRVVKIIVLRHSSNINNKI